MTGRRYSFCSQRENFDGVATNVYRSMSRRKLPRLNGIEAASVGGLSLAGAGRGLAGVLLAMTWDWARRSGACVYCPDRTITLSQYATYTLVTLPGIAVFGLLDDLPTGYVQVRIGAIITESLFLGVRRSDSAVSDSQSAG
jgi:hypothetical protein